MKYLRQKTTLFIASSICFSFFLGVWAGHVLTKDAQKSISDKEKAVVEKLLR